MVTIKLENAYQKMDLIRLIEYAKRKKKEDLKNGKILESVYLYELNNIAKLELSINDKIDKIKAIKELGQ